MRKFIKRLCPALSYALLAGISTVSLGNAPAPGQTVYTFRQDLNGYTGTVDTFVSNGILAAVNGAAEFVRWDTDDPIGTGLNTYALIRFDNIFGPVTGQIPVGSVVTSATLKYYFTSGSSVGVIHEPIVPWDETSSANTFGPTPGVQTSDYATRILSTAWSTGTSRTINVWENVVKWAIDPALNNGWLIRPGNTINFGTIHSSEYLLDPTLRPTLTITVNTSATPALVRDPYLQMASSTGMTIAWRTDMLSDSVVSYGLAPGALTQSVTINESVRDHAVRITGLQPATKYYYSVGTTAGAIPPGLNPLVFTTSPSPGSAVPFTFWFFADSGVATPTQAATRDAMLASIGGMPDLILPGGDLAYIFGGDCEYTDAFFKPYAAILSQTPSWPSIGSHEILNASASAQTGPYFDAFSLPTLGEAGGVASGTKAYYSFDYANAHFISVNTSGGDTAPGGAMLTWLAQDLAATTADWVIAVLHHAPYSNGPHSSDTDGKMIAARTNIVPILESFGVDLVLGGYSHGYERSFLIDGAYETPSIVGTHILDAGDGNPASSGAYLKPPGRVGNAGAVYAVVGNSNAAHWVMPHPLMIFGENQTGSAVVRINGSALNFSHVRSTGFVSDVFTILKQPPPPADLNGDGFVNGADLAQLLAQWGGAGTADLNVDGVVNSADLAILLAQWG